MPVSVKRFAKCQCTTVDDLPGSIMGSYERASTLLTSYRRAGTLANVLRGRYEVLRKASPVATDTVVLGNVLVELALRQLPCGPWVAFAPSLQPAIGPTCYSTLASGSAPLSYVKQCSGVSVAHPKPNGGRLIFELLGSTYQRWNRTAK